VCGYKTGNAKLRCKICLSNQNEVIFSDRGHCLCFGCANKLKDVALFVEKRFQKGKKYGLVGQQS